VDNVTTYHALAVAARATLEAAGLSAAEARLDADLLARHALGWDQAAWLGARHDRASSDFAPAFAALIARRAAREPVAYIRGLQEFWGRDFVVTPAVLIPRPETELLIEVSREFLAVHPASVVADIGTGSGCLAITVALEHPAASVFATDLSADALAVARQNAARLGAADRIAFVHGRYLDGVPRPLDLIVSNPPYISLQDRVALQPEVAKHEPALALFGGDDGLRDVRAILDSARHALSPTGLIACEVGIGQAETIARELAATDGLDVVEIRRDLQGIPRIVVARRSRSSSPRTPSREADEPRDAEHRNPVTQEP
jgi:release factor glutamine methyltransferase